MAGILKIVLVTLSIITLIHQSEAVKCLLPGGLSQTCDRDGGFNCAVSKTTAMGQSAEAPSGCVTDATKDLCNKKKEAAGTTVETCCCYSSECNKDMKTCKSGSMKQYGSFGMMVLMGIVSWLMI